jgi:hypothetical protein
LLLEKEAAGKKTRLIAFFKGWEKKTRQFCPFKENFSAKFKKQNSKEEFIRSF